ncbi:hypothetical protein SCHPADRAFT_612396 [Schizopora paradoxa]|uniref:Uncharacterized protein n=1 Tax=Schizopora paradoxa TaxID=27342 RepID=A0A0H2R919_9AGAM|nr:hypothetical protein SCHPADRAFT_612396 [Schizopora paradoxa]
MSKILISSVFSMGCPGTIASASRQEPADDVCGAFFLNVICHIADFYNAFSRTFEDRRSIIRLRRCVPPASPSL